MISDGSGLLSGVPKISATGQRRRVMPMPRSSTHATAGVSAKPSVPSRLSTTAP